MLKRVTFVVVLIALALSSQGAIVASPAKLEWFSPLASPNKAQYSVGTCGHLCITWTAKTYVGDTQNTIDYGCASGDVSKDNYVVASDSTCRGSIGWTGSTHTTYVSSTGWYKLTTYHTVAVGAPRAHGEQEYHELWVYVY